MIAGALLIVFASTNVQAEPLQLIYQGVFNTQNALNPAGQVTPTYFTTATPFKLIASFDTSSPNLAPPSPPAPPPFAGFRAFAPSLVTITIGAETYIVETITTNPTAGAAPSPSSTATASYRGATGSASYSSPSRTAPALSATS